MAPIGCDDECREENQADSGREVAEAIVEWYWKYGVARQGAYAISRVWLNSLYQHRDLLRSVENGRAQKKASLGLWGPSQSGKSTLISQFVDQGSDASGKGGALHWDSPTLFSSRVDLPDNVVVFNPHNVGADASGCVSRFVLRDDSQVPFHDFPVELRLLSPSQLMHAISAGYLSECQREENWTVDRLEELLEKNSGTANPLRIDRQAFEHLHEVIDIIGLLIEARDERFTGLDADGNWSLLSNRIVDSGFLLSDKSKVQEFAAKLLWGGQPALTRLYERLKRAREALPNKRLYCSMEVAATLVNIESYRIFQSKDNEAAIPKGALRIKNVIRRLSWEERGSTVVIGTNFPDRKLLERDEDFGLLQGLVRELVIPLRSRQSQTGEKEFSDFSRFMNSVELVDFPGVPLRDQNAKEKLLDLGSLSDSEDSRLLTDVLKRGKVASLVNGYSRSLGLDSFMLLVRAGHFAPKPEQLHRGLIAWWKFVDPRFDVYKRLGRRPPLPLFFNMTFFANIIDKVAQGAVSTGLHPLSEMVRQLEPFVDPSVCTMLTTTYPQFEEGKIHVPPASAAAAVQSVLSDPSFGPRCSAPATKESLARMAAEPDGGVDYLFRVLADSISPSGRLKLLDDRYREALLEIQGLIEDQSPQEGNNQCLKDVEAVKAAIKVALLERSRDNGVSDHATWVSYRLRKLFDVSADVLDSIPSGGQNLQRYEVYVQNQLKKWIESKSSYSGLSDMGLRDPALRTRLLGFLSERVQICEVAKWIRNELPAARSREDSRELRRILAIMLSNQLARSENTSGTHPALAGKDGVIATIRKWAEVEDSDDANFDVRQSPHFTSVIVPFVRVFDEMAKGTQGNRPQQAGDDEAIKLLGAVRTCLGSGPA